MPAPARPAPIKVIPDSTRFTNGIVGVYSDAEIDALLANLQGGDSVVVVHDEPLPQPTAPTPQGVEDSFAAYPDGLHYFKPAGALVSIVRAQYQTDIVVNGSLRSVAKVVKSEAGLPTPQNPSTLLTADPTGKWMKVESDELNTPFGPPKMVDLFALQGGGVVDLSGYYTKPEIDSSLTALSAQFLEQTALDYVNSQLQALATVTQDAVTGLDKKADKASVAADVAALMTEDIRIEGLVKSTASTLMNSIMEVKTDTYTKQEVDDKLEADKDFSIANDNVLLATITSLQEVVNNLGEFGTHQIEVLAAIKGVEIEPSSVKFTDSVASPIQWKGGLSLAPVKEGDNYHIAWTDGKATSNLATLNDLAGYVPNEALTTEALVRALDGQEMRFGTTSVTTLVVNELYVGNDSGRLVTQLEGGPENKVAYMADLSAYGTKEALDLLRSQLQIVFDSIYTREESDGRYATKTSVNLLGDQLQAVMNAGYTQEESRALFAKKQDNTQQLLAKTVVAQGYGFGDSSQPPVALAYTDTGEGYDKRLVLNIGLTNEYLVYKSDLDDLNALLPRMERLEGKAAPVVDLDPYITLVDADARYGTKEALDLLRSQTQIIFDSVYTRQESDARYESKEAGDLLRGQMQTVFDSIYTRAEADARYYTQKQADDRFMRIDQAFSKADFDNQMALVLYSRKQIDDRLAAINPLGSPSINDPALADFKKSVLDSVALMLAGGGKQPPPDLPWTNLRTAAGTADSPTMFVRMIGGVMEFKGTLSTSSISGSQNVLQLPASFPLPELNASYPIAARLVGTNAVYTYANFSNTNRTIGVTMASTINEITLSGLRVKAAY